MKISQLSKGGGVHFWYFYCKMFYYTPSGKKIKQNTLLAKDGLFFLSTSRSLFLVPGMLVLQATPSSSSAETPPRPAPLPPATRPRHSRHQV